MNKETSITQIGLTEEALKSLAEDLAKTAQKGDVFLLEGQLGAGKTSFARAFLQARGETGTIPSPTFPLVQIYDLPTGAVWHFDLYRLDKPEDAFELGIEEAFGSAISLIEWGARLGGNVPENATVVEITFSDDENKRDIVVKTR
ncbi:MAG: tRNA (adenosine(37)-N6)-threonylcarbamoyltransferase complex ATPase subunit type 1 TsaE [Alphaproteobacteria bacterium]